MTIAGIAFRLALAVAPPAGPVEVVKAVYTGHFAHQQRWDETLKRDRAQFSPALLALLDADARAAAASPDEVVGLDFDPLTNAQEEATGCKVGLVRFEAGAASVPVEIKFGATRVPLTVRLVRVGTQWRIDNILSKESDLVRTLKDLTRERAQSKQPAPGAASPSPPAGEGDLVRTLKELVAPPKAVPSPKASAPPR